MKSGLVFFVVFCLSFFTALSQDSKGGKKGGRDEKVFIIREESVPNLELREGLVCLEAQTINIVREENVIATVKVGEPVLVAMADKREYWGYFQFPTIFRRDNGDLILRWAMNADSVGTYGRESSGGLMSKDEGETWQEIEGRYFRRGRRRLEYPNGNILQQTTPTPKILSDYNISPVPVNANPINGYVFYYEKDLPTELRGIYFTLWDKEQSQSSILHGSINDPDLLRCSIDGQMPIVWWGDIRMLDDSVLLAGVYGGYYLNKDGNPLRSSVSFYQSYDNGNHWDVISIIPYSLENERDYNSFVFDGVDGFTEPAFEILKNGSLLCVMRTGDTSPLYRIFSSDCGYHWSVPEPFTPNGVMPLLMTLDNGILVLASGRPGMQLRFNLDGDGKVWTEPIDMFPFIDEDGNVDVWGSCGYPSILPVDDNTFYIVYSNFRTKNKDNEYRKSIFFRKIEVKRL